MSAPEERPDMGDPESVAAEVAARLRTRGIDVDDDEPPEQLADLLNAVERFEALVEARGGDLMVDDLKSSEPDDPHFVLPQRESGKDLPSYISRIEEAITRVEAHPPIS
jgi:hypothetical protein